MFKLIGKTIITTLKVSLSGPYGHVYFRSIYVDTDCISVREAGKGAGGPFAINKWSGAIKARKFYSFCNLKSKINCHKHINLL